MADGNAPGAEYADEFQATDRRRRVIADCRLIFLNQLTHVYSSQTPGHDPQARPVTRSSATIQSRGFPKGRQDNRQDHVAARRPGRLAPRRSLSGTLRTNPRADRDGREILRTKKTVDRLIFSCRVLPGIGGSVQSVDRSAPRSVGPPYRSLTIYPQPARYRGGAHFLHHFSHGDHSRRPSDRGRSSHRISHGAASNSESALREGALRAKTV